MFIFSFPAWFGVSVFALAALAAAFIPYVILRKLFSERLSEDTQTLSSSITVRLGALHALILALVFAQEQINYTQVRRTIVDEAAATADVYYELERYDVEKTNAIRLAVARYVQTVIEDEWALLARERLSDKAWEYYTEVDLGLLRLEPENRLQEDLRAQMLQDWDAISEYRRARETAAMHEVPGFFWVVAVLGFLLVTLPYFAFEPSPANLFALASFAVYNGIVFYFIASISNPFAGPAPLEPTAFYRLFSEDMAGVLQTLQTL